MDTAYQFGKRPPFHSLVGGADGSIDYLAEAVRARCGEFDVVKHQLAAKEYS